MRAFVTGATGGLGRNLCLRLAGRCTGTGRDPVAGRWLEAAGISFRPLDLGDRAGMAEAMAGHDVVFHCAALSSLWGTPQAFETANVVGTANVLTAARQAGIRRVVVVSSPSVCFDFRHRRAIREDEALPARQVNAYAASKRAAEDLVRAAVSAGQDCVILRPRGIIGPWDKALAPRLARVARRGFVPLPGGGNAVVDVTCMDNAVDAVLAAAAAGPEIAGRTYNISNGDPVRVAELMAGALDAMGIRARLLPLPAAPLILAGRLLEMAARLREGWEPPVTAYSLALLAYDQTLDIGAARRDLGWEPRQGWKEGLSAMGAWWREHHAGD